MSCGPASPPLSADDTMLNAALRIVERRGCAAARRCSRRSWWWVRQPWRALREADGRTDALDWHEPMRGLARRAHDSVVRPRSTIVGQASAAKLVQGRPSRSNAARSSRCGSATSIDAAGVRNAAAKSSASRSIDALCSPDSRCSRRVPDLVCDREPVPEHVLAPPRCRDDSSAGRRSPARTHPPRRFRRAGARRPRCRGTPPWRPDA